MRVRMHAAVPCPLLLLLALVVAGLPALAHASAPDPSWIAGIYDGADYDDVVVLVTLASGDLGSVHGADVRPTLQAVGSPPPFPEGAVHDVSASPVLPRGPPSV